MNMKSLEMARSRYLGGSNTILVITVVILFSVALAVVKSMRAHFNAPPKLHNLPISVNVTEKEESYEPREHLAEDTIHFNTTKIGVYDIYWSSPPGPTKGILIAFHGCTHSGRDWFVLPEEKTIVQSTLDNGITVICPSSVDRASGCWGDEVDSMVPVLKAFISRHISSTSVLPFPIFGIGASSGGIFLSVLAAELPLAAFIVQVASPEYSSLKQYKSTRTKHVVFVIMRRDRHFATRPSINKGVELLTELGINSTVYECSPRKITESYFSERVRGISTVDSEKMHSVLGAYLENGYLVKDPRKTNAVMDIVKSVSDETLQRFGDQDFEDIIRELLNIAYGEHELTSEHYREILSNILIPISESGNEVLLEDDNSTYTKKDY